VTDRKGEAGGESPPALDDYTRLTSADLKVRREALGISQDWLARQVGVQDRTVRRWEAGEFAIPADVWEVLEFGESMADEILEAVCEILQDLEEGAVDGIDLTVYPTSERLWRAHPEFAPWPASWHRGVCARVRELTDWPVRFHFPDQ
jgi:DNA-binding XRE family transcriptional regulator